MGTMSLSGAHQTAWLNRYSDARVAVPINRRNTMSRTRQTSIFILLPALVLLAGLGTSLLSGRSSAQTTQSYAWRNVQIVDGGFVPGIIFNQTEPGLVYARTDIGGAYRQDPVTKRWTSL